MIQSRVLPDIMTRVPLAPPPNTMLMYALAFDIDLDALPHVGGIGLSMQTAYCEIRKILESEGFLWQQCGLQLGPPEAVDAMTCVHTAHRLARELHWFAGAVRDLRILLVAENICLQPALALR